MPFLRVAGLIVVGLPAALYGCYLLFRCCCLRGPSPAKKTTFATNTIKPAIKRTPSIVINTPQLVLSGGKPATPLPVEPDPKPSYRDVVLRQGNPPRGRSRSPSVVRRTRDSSNPARRK